MPVRSLSGIKLLGINDKALQVNNKVIELDHKLVEKSAHDLMDYKNLGLRLIKRTQKEFLKNNKKEDQSNYIFGIPF